MRGFFLLIFSFSLGANTGFFTNVTSGNGKKLSTNVIKEIGNTLFVGGPDAEKPDGVQSLVKKITKNESHLNNCFFIKELKTGIIYSPTKIFNPVNINENGVFLLPIDPVTSNTQISIEIEKNNFNFYTGLFEKKEDCYSLEYDGIDLNNLEKLGTSLLFNKGEMVSSINLDKEHSLKFLKNNWVLAYGVTAGNVTLSIKLKNNKKINKVLHLYDNQVTVISDSLSIKPKMQYDIFELRLMADKKQPLSLEKYKITNFFSKRTLKYEKNRLYKKEQVNLRGFKELLKIEPDGNTFLNVSSSRREIIFANNDYKNYFLRINNLEEQEDFCLIHFPVENEILSSDFVLSDGFKTKEVDVYFLNRDGGITSMPSKKSHQILVAGYSGGVVDYKIGFKNKNIYGQSLCGLGSYLIEN